MRKDAALAFWHLFGEMIETEMDTDIPEGGKQIHFSAFMAYFQYKRSKEQAR